MHSKLNYKNNIYLIIVSLIPLLLYGIYKNGYLLNQKDLVSFIGIFKPLILILISIGIYEIINLIFKRKCVINYTVVSLIILSMIMPPTVNYLVFVGILSIFLIIDQFLSKVIIYNKVVVMKLIIVLVLLLMGSYSYYNLAEGTYEYAFNFLDIFMGRGISGIACSSVFLIILSYIFLARNAIYKRLIPVVSYLVYLIGVFIYFFITKEINILLLINANVIFVFVFVATDSVTTPYTPKKIIIYSSFLGILSLVFCYIVNVYEGVYIAIFVENLTLYLLNYKKRRKNIGFFLENKL